MHCIRMIVLTKFNFQPFSLLLKYYCKPDLDRKAYDESEIEINKIKNSFFILRTKKTDEL